MWGRGVSSQCVIILVVAIYRNIKILYKAVSGLTAVPDAAR